MPENEYMPSIVSGSANIGLILLAGGASARLGHLKQLLAYQGQSLLQHSIKLATGSRAKPVIVVLGAHAEELQPEIHEGNAHVVINTGWQEGMAASIRFGVHAFTELAPAAEGLILMVCDQPFVTSEVLNELIITQERTGKKIVACGYEDTFGPPVFFHRSLFGELQQLQGDIGARSIIRQHTNLVELIPFPQGSFDIDSEADYEQLQARRTNDQ
jgi:molybdenum cofactor cytidylyltransferase